MSRPAFGEGVLVALIAAMLASLGEIGLARLLPSEDAAQALGIGLGLGYGLYLLARSGEPGGRLVIVCAWVAASLLVWATFAVLWAQILLQLALVSLTRALHYHARPVGALLDLALVLLGFTAALWALERTGNLFVAVWVMLLIQALFALIPRRSVGSHRAGAGRDDPFAAAQRAAERALRRLSARH